MTFGDVLWDAARRHPGAVARSGATSAGSSGQTGRAFDGYHDLWQWSVDDLPGFWGSVWDHAELGARWRPTGCSTERSMPGATWFPDVELSYAERAPAAAMPTGSRSCPCRSAAATSTPHARRAARPGRPVPGRAAAARRRPRRSGRRLPAEHRRDARRVPRHGQPRRGVGVVRAGVRHRQRGGPVPADRPEGAAHHRRLPLRGQGDRPTGRGGRDPRGAARPGRHRARCRTSIPTPTIAGHHAVVGRWSPRPVRSSSSRCRSTTRSTSSTRRARPGCPSRSSTATAASSLEHAKALGAPEGHRPGRPLLLVLHDRLDDVELPGVRAPRRRDRGVLRRRPRLARPRRDSGRWRPSSGVTSFGTSAPFLMACRKAGLTPGRRRTTWRPCASVGSTGAPLPAEGFEWVYEAVRDDVVPLVDLRWHRRVLGVRRRVGAAAGPLRGDRGAAASAPRWRPCSPTGEPLVGEQGELVISEPLPSMPVGFWGDDDGSAATGPPTSSASPAAGTTATGSPSRPTARA